MTIEINEQNHDKAVQLIETAIAMREQQNEFFQLDRKAKIHKSLYTERNKALDMAKALERTFDRRRDEFMEGLANG